MTYEIKLPQFEGPFDLLLFFIERDELDIYDIPISKITDDFLNYLHQLKLMNIEVASEFILVAATLMKIKARMLLPRREVNEEGEAIDPREELVARLLEYKRYKSVLEDFKKMEALRQSRAKRGNVDSEVKTIAEKYATEAELDTLSLYRLLQVFQRVMLRLEEKPEVKHQVVQYDYSIEGQKEYLVKKVGAVKKADFEKVFSSSKNKIHAIFTFLALLELINLKVLAIQVGLGMNNFWISEGAEYAGAATS